jgi:hypothetical protein
MSKWALGPVVAWFVEYGVHLLVGTRQSLVVLTEGSRVQVGQPGERLPELRVSGDQRLDIGEAVRDRFGHGVSRGSGVAVSVAAG